MDTSDSEHFESADEDLHSDDETDQEIPKNPEIATKKETLESSEDVENDSKVNEIQNLKIDDEISKKEVTETVKTVTEVVEVEGTNKNTITKDNPEEEHGSGNDDRATSTKKKSTKSKLGSKIAKDVVHFDATPKKTAPVVREVKEAEAEKISEPKGDLWDEDELDWGTEGKLENELRQEDIQISHQNKTVESNSCKSQVQKRPQETSTSDSWGGWGNWGVSVLSSAGQSVSSITSQLTNVIESSLGAVDPEELAKIDSENKKKLEELLDEKIEDGNTEESGVFGLGNLVKLVENTGTKVISGGLDTLETIGKKTMEVLQDGDPGLKKKRAFLKIDKDKPVLSQILREAKGRAENTNKTLEEPSKKTKNYLTLLDDFQGLVHLEALELLSKQCEIKLKNIQNSLTGSHHTKFVEKIEQTKELCELIDKEDEEADFCKFEEIFKNAAIKMEVQISFEKLLKYWEETNNWLDTLDVGPCDEKELHQKAIETLAQVTSMAMEQFHKFAELALVKDKRLAREEAVNVALIASTLISLVGIISDKFVEKLNSKIPQSSEKDIREIITNIFYETATTSGNIEDALQLLIPIIQIGEIGSE